MRLGKYVEGKRFAYARNLNDNNIKDVYGAILMITISPEDRIITLISTMPHILQTDTTDGRGNFEFLLPDYVDGTLFTLQVANLKGVKQNDKIVLYKSEFPNLHTPIQLKKRFPAPAEEALNYFKNHQLDSLVNAKGSEWLKEVSVETIAVKNVNYDITKRFAQNSHIITSELIESTHVTNLVTLLQQSPGVRMSQGVLTIGGVSGGHRSVIDGVRAGRATINTLINYRRVRQLYESYGTRRRSRVAGGVGVISLLKHEERTKTSTGIGLMKFYPKAILHQIPSISGHDLKEIKSNYQISVQQFIGMGIY
jgi:hypothetical protein